MTDYSIDALLFQTGYLTLTGKESSEDLTEYRLDYPNHEVALSLNRGLLHHVTGNDHITQYAPTQSPCAFSSSQISITPSNTVSAVPVR